MSREAARGHLLAPPPPSRGAQPGARVTGPGARATAVICPRARGGQGGRQGEPRGDGRCPPRSEAVNGVGGGKGLKQTVPAGVLRPLWEPALNFILAGFHPRHRKWQQTPRGGAEAAAAPPVKV